MKREMTTEKDLNDYIRTGKTTVLAVIKLIEALAGCFAVWYLLTHMNIMPDVLKNLLEIQTDGENKYVYIYQSVFNGIQIGIIVKAALLIPDGLAVCFTRFTRRGAGAAAFFQFLSFVTGIIVFLLGFAGMVFYCNSVIEAARSIRRITMEELIGIFGTSRVAAFLTVYIIVFLIIIIYHFRAGSIMIHVRKEIKVNSLLRQGRKNRLGGAATAYAIVFTINAILSVMILITDEQRLSDIAGFLKPAVSAYRLSGTAGIAASIFLTVKFFLVSRCNTDFNRTHRKLNR